MPSNMEIRVLQKGMLFKLKMMPEIVQENEAFQDLLAETEVSMEQEDIAFVDKKIEERKAKSKR